MTWTRKIIGDGIPGVITPAEIRNAIGNYEMAFFRKNGKWRLGPNVLSSYNGTEDCGIDLLHDTDECDFSEDYTVTDYITSVLDAHEDAESERLR